MEKGEIAQNEQFHHFPQCFPKAFLFNLLKRVYMEGRIKPVFPHTTNNTLTMKGIE